MQQIGFYNYRLDDRVLLESDLSYQVAKIKESLIVLKHLVKDYSPEYIILTGKSNLLVEMFLTFLADELRGIKIVFWGDKINRIVYKDLGGADLETRVGRLDVEITKGFSEFDKSKRALVIDDCSISGGKSSAYRNMLNHIGMEDFLYVVFTSDPEARDTVDYVLSDNEKFYEFLRTLSGFISLVTENSMGDSDLFALQSTAREILLPLLERLYAALKSEFQN